MRNELISEAREKESARKKESEEWRRGAGRQAGWLAP